MYGGVALAIAVYAAFAIIPTIGNVVISVTDYTAIPGASTDFVGLKNYKNLFTSQLPAFLASLSATLVFVLGVTLSQNVLALMFAHRLADGTRSADILRVLVFLPIVLGVTVVGLIWLVMFDPTNGPAARILGVFGVHSSFFGSTEWAMPLVIVVQVWQNLGFTMLLYIGALKAVPVSVYEASSLDGATGWTRFRSITWPLLAPSVTVSLVYAVVGTLTTYNLIYVLTNGQYGTETLGMLAFHSAFGRTANLGLGAAVTTSLIVITVFVAIPLAVLLRWRERRILG
ncbi:MAG: sugar ABC transporter permease [Microbacterium sp.]